MGITDNNDSPKKSLSRAHTVSLETGSCNVWMQLYDTLRISDRCTVHSTCAQVAKKVVSVCVSEDQHISELKITTECTLAYCPGVDLGFHCAIGPYK